VLCPNAALCNQVKLVADSLTDLDGKPLLETAHVSNSSPPPFTVPDIIVTTPASLINITEASHYGPEWTKGGILARYAYMLGYALTGALGTHLDIFDDVLEIKHDGIKLVLQ
jgi:hypothetical protein